MHAPLIGWAVGIKKPEFAFGLFCLYLWGIQKLSQLPDFTTVSLSRQNMDDTFDCAQLIIDRFRDQLDPVVRVKVEPEESD